MEWEMLPDGRSCLPRGTILKFEFQGGCYRILGAPIGYGGAGILYPAVRVVKKEGCWAEDGMWVALKECYPYCTDGMIGRRDSGEIHCVNARDTYTAEYYASAKEMMRREKEITGQIFHRGFRLTPLWDIAEQEEISLDGEHFLPTENQYGIMERLDEKGCSLGTILKRQQGGCLTAYQSVCILEQILEAVEEVHHAGYLHGDIQENNIFLKGTESVEEGMVTLIDFGSARELLEDGATAVIWDKKLYSASGCSAPECAAGNDGTLRLTRAADIYSVGYLMLRLLVGKALERGALRLVVNGKYLYPRQAKRIGCPSGSIEAVNRILQKALREEPGERYQTAEEMLEEIRRLERALAPKKSAIASVDYEAFISYCHEEKSIRAAEQIQKMIERYKIPKPVQKQSGRKKLRKVFRDREELASSSDMEVHLKEALEHSEYLIVLLSPGVPDSLWVNREIQLFLESHSRDHLLTILVDGELTESFPEYLRRSEKLEEGQIKVKPVECLAADIRGADKREQKQKLKTEIYRLLAPMLGCSYDDLRQRQKEYRMQKILRSMAAAVFLIGIVAACITRQAFQIQKNYWETLKKQSRYLAEVSSELLGSGDRIKALQVALEALPQSGSDKSRPKTAEAEAALANALYAYQGVDAIAHALMADYRVKMDAKSVGQNRLSPEGTWVLTMDDNRTVYLWDTASGGKKGVWDRAFCKGQGIDGEILFCDFLDEDTVLLVTSECFLRISIDGEKETVYQKPEKALPVTEEVLDGTHCILSEDREYLAVYDEGYGGYSLAVYKISDGQQMYSRSLQSLVEENLSIGILTDFCFCPDGQELALTFRSLYWYEAMKETEHYGGMLIRVDWEKDSMNTAVDEDYCFTDCRFLPDGKLAVFGYAPSIASDSYEAECPGEMVCYPPEKQEPLWKRELICHVGPSMVSGILGDEETGNWLLWCGRQLWVLDGASGEVVRTPFGENGIAGVFRRKKGDYLLVQQDGSMYFMSGGEIFVKLGTNVKLETTDALFDAQNFAVYLFSGEDGSMVGMKKMLDPEGVSVELARETVGISIHASVPYYSVWQYREGQERYTLVFYDRETHQEQFELETDGLVEEEIWLKDGKTFCYFEITPEGERQITAFDTGEKKQLWQKKMEGYPQVTFATTDAGEALAVYNENGTAQLLDLETGETLELADKSDPPLRYGTVVYAGLSGTGDYLVTMETKDAGNGETGYGLQICDRREETWLVLSEELQELTFSSTYRRLWMAERKNLAAVYEEGENQILILDLEKAAVIQSIPFQGNEQRILTFLEDDGALLLWGDDGYLKLWNLEKECITMEDTRRLCRVSGISVYEESGLIEIRGIDEDSMDLFLGNLWMKWFYRMEEGRFYPYVCLLNSVYDPDTGRFGEISTNNTTISWYDTYSLDELLEKARKKVGDSDLSEADRVKYYIGE